MLLVFLLAACAVSIHGKVEIVRTGDQAAKDKYIEAGKKLILTCKDPSSTSLSWSKYTPFDGRTEDVTIATVSAPGESQIVLSNLNDMHTGKYTCKNERGESDIANVNVLGPNALVSEDHPFNGTTSQVVLRCNQRLVDKIPLVWSRNNGSGSYILNDLGDKNAVVGDEKSNFSLTIRNVEGVRTPSKYGEYQCGFLANDTTPQTAASISKRVNYQATPDIKFDGSAKTKSATKDESFLVTCVVSGSAENSPITWWRRLEGAELYSPITSARECSSENNTATGRTSKLVCGSMDGKFNIIQDIEATEKACNITEPKAGEQCSRYTTLQFLTVVDEDRGDYACEAENEHGRNRVSVPLKVKDKLAALWPFLGIVAEVVILCAIIFIYERRRSKSIEEEDEAEPMKTVEARDVNDNVRSRKA